MKNLDINTLKYRKNSAIRKELIEAIENMDDASFTTLFDKEIPLIDLYDVVVDQYCITEINVARKLTTFEESLMDLISASDTNNVRVVCEKEILRLFDLKYNKFKCFDKIDKSFEFEGNYNIKYKPELLNILKDEAGMYSAYSNYYNDVSAEIYSYKPFLCNKYNIDFKDFTNALVFDIEGIAKIITPLNAIEILTSETDPSKYKDMDVMFSYFGGFEEKGINNLGILLKKGLNSFDELKDFICSGFKEENIYEDKYTR